MHIKMKQLRRRRRNNEEGEEEEEEESDVVVVLLLSLVRQRRRRWGWWRWCLLLHCSTDLFILFSSFPSAWNLIFCMDLTS